MSPADVVLPVTVAATRRPAPGRTAELRAWAVQLCAAAESAPGFLDSAVGTGPAGVTTTLTFRDAGAAAGWERSAARATLLDRAVPLTDGPPRRAAPPAAPPRWRTALVVWAGLFPFSLLSTAFLAPRLATAPVFLQSLVTSAVLVPLAVYVGIPTVNALLRRSR